ncbi:MAG: hypothetical protein HY232_03885 [Acidobacteria bacterium]|nr:hypothetical protein [Acidobacteriota bacterium]
MKIGYARNVSDRAMGLGVFFISILGLVTFLPAFNNFFISDDFVYLRLCKSAGNDVLSILSFPPDLRRLTGHIYFFICYKLFRLNSAGYYAIMIGIHIFNSYLVYRLVARLTGERHSGLIAGLFFVVYERHQEAIMWIAAVNELFLGLSALLCLIFLHKCLSEKKNYGKYHTLTIITFILSLFSKESSIVLFPIMLLAYFLLAASSPNKFLESRVKLFLPLGCLWLAYLISSYLFNAFIADGFYAITPHFFLVYSKTVNRLLLFVYVFVGLLYFSDRSPQKDRVRALRGNRAFLFFLIWILFTPLPYCFLTYLDHIPSRHTYLPSVGSAALVGILMTKVYASFSYKRLSKRIPAYIFTGVLLLNIIYVWKKDRQFVKRAEPTKLVLQILRADASLPGSGKNVYIIGDSPMGMENTIQAAIEVFTDIKLSNIILVKPVDERKLHAQEQDYIFGSSGYRVGKSS